MSDISSTTEQESKPASSSGLADGADQAILNHTEALPYSLQRRLEVLQRLKSYEGSKRYVQERKKAAQELSLSDRSLRRLIHQFREQGIAGIIRQSRSDQGQLKVSEDWHQFIVQTYRKGNRGMRHTAPAQVANLVQSRAAKLGHSSYPSRATVYRILESEVKSRSLKKKRRGLGWTGETLKLTTREGIELNIEYSNQVWQCDHTPADILVVDQQGDILGRPTLTTIVDTYSRCIMGIYIGLSYPSAAVTCLALRHAILPKQYGAEYELMNLWGTYGVPQYLYTDGGSDFTSHHIDQVAASLGIVLCLRRRPSDGGIVERPFGTLNSEFFSTLPGYTTNRLKHHRKQAESEARLTLHQLERLLVRYIVDRYNQLPDPRLGKDSRLARWEAGRIAQPPLIEERALDLLLMRQDRRRVYRGGYIRFSNLIYRGEYLAGYTGQQVILRYDPRDITSLLIYRQEGPKDVFLTRARAQNLETEHLSLSEAKAISRRLRQASEAVTNQSVLAEVRDRTQFIDNLLEQPFPIPEEQPDLAPRSSTEREEEAPDDPIVTQPLPEIRVYDYETLRREHGL